MRDPGADGWGVLIHRLPTTASAWNPGRCTPIAVTIGRNPYGRARFLARIRHTRAVAWADAGGEFPDFAPIPRRR
jgi:hypothetical protein